MPMSEPIDPAATMGSAILNAILDSSRVEIDGVSTAIVNPQDAERAIIVALAMMLEADPTIRTPKDMREASERIARGVRLQLRVLRDHHEATGTRAWDAVPLQTH